MFLSYLALAILVIVIIVVVYAFISNQEAALAAYGQKALVAFTEVENALAGEKLLKEREQLLKTAAEQNDEALRVAKVRYDAGKISMLDVLTMHARANLSRSALIDMEQRRLAQRIDLHLALGGSFDAAPPPASMPSAAKTSS